MEFKTNLFLLSNEELLEYCLDISDELHTQETYEKSNSLSLIDLSNRLENTKAEILKRMVNNGG